MMQLLFAFLLVSALAELRAKRSTFGHGNHPVPEATNGAGARHLQDCEVIRWAELCERKKLTVGSCFQLKPSVEAPFCELQSHGAPVQLRPAAGAAAGILTLSSGELRITGQFQMTSLRLVAKSVLLADAHVEAWHGAPSPNSTAPGGAFYSKGSFTLTRSRLTVRDAGATTMSGGGFAADGDLSVRHSEVVIENVAAMYGAGFSAGNIDISDNSRILIQNTRCSKNGGAFQTGGRLQVTHSSVVSLQNVTAGHHGGGFIALEEVEIAGNSTVNISNSHAGTGDGGGFHTGSGLNVSSGSRVILQNATAAGDGGGFFAKGRTFISHSTVSIQNARALLGAGFYSHQEVVIDGMSSVRISDARSKVQGGGFETDKWLQVTNSSLLSLQNVTTGGSGGGFVALEEVEIARNSTVNISSGHAETGEGGGFMVATNLKVSFGSKLIIRNATGEFAGGFGAGGRTFIISRSTVSIQHVTSLQIGGGFRAGDEVVIDGMSSVRISDARSEGNGGGIVTGKRLQVSNSSVLSLQNVTAGSNGGGFVALGKLEIAGNSTVNISNSHAESGKGGGFVGQDVKVSSGSRLILWNATAGRSGGGFVAYGRTSIISMSTVSIQHATSRQYGGGFYAGDEVVIDGMSCVRISHSRSKGNGGGLATDKWLQVTNSSLLSLQNVTSGRNGRGFLAFDGVEIAGDSTVNISNSHAGTGDGGGFHTGSGLNVSSGSRVILRNATAGTSGGGFFAIGRILISHSTVSIQNARAWLLGAGFCAEGVAYVNASAVAMLSTHTGSDGGAFSVLGLTLHRSSISIGNSTAVGSGSGGRVDGQVLLSSQSNLVVKQAQGRENSSVLAASCLHLRDQSRVLFEDVISGHGVELQNSGCSRSCSNSTFHVAADAVLNASGRFSSGLLSLAACPKDPKEKVRLSGIHLQSSSSLLSTQPSVPSSVVVDQVTIDYKPPVNNLQILAAKDGFEIDSLTVSCQNCTWGITLSATKDGKQLSTVSSEHLQCSKTATVSKGKTQHCKCSGYQIAAKNLQDLVPLERTFETCTFCKPHFYFQNGDCQKCGIFIAWSDGRTDSCNVLPGKTELITLLTGAAVMVLLTFFAFEILKAPLVIIDAKSDLADPTQAESKRMFTLSVQGPIVDLHDSLSRLVHWWVRYQAKGTGLRWLDYDHKKTKAVKVHNIAHRRLLLQNTNPDFDCASCKGSLHAVGFINLLGLITVCISVITMLPVIIQVAVISGNGVKHVSVTSIYMTVPCVALAAVLHWPVAWLIQWRYHRTSFSRALDEYSEQIKCKPAAGSDASHPRNQGLEVLTLRGLWKHFESFILERNMHFVVANIVMPLTQSKRISFVTLWGGRQVDYFVSHCWGGSFPHLVQSIECHALSKEGPASWFYAAYWICSFANNQWNIGAELGSDPMESAFALALTSGIKGVAMVLDREVRPLTRVWCLFEYFLSSREHLELVFVTNAGVIGDDGCSSFDIALEVGKKIKSLQVAKCEATSEKDKTDIVEYIISELGSLERMDKQIRANMSEMLMRNLANVERATGSLVDSLGEGSAETVHEESS